MSSDITDEEYVGMLVGDRAQMSLEYSSRLLPDEETVHSSRHSSSNIAMHRPFPSGTHIDGSLYLPEFDDEVTRELYRDIRYELEGLVIEGDLVIPVNCIEVDLLSLRDTVVQGNLVIASYLLELDLRGCKVAGVLGIEKAYQNEACFVHCDAVQAPMIALLNPQLGRRMLVYGAFG